MTLYEVIRDWFSTYVFVGLPSASYEIGGLTMTLEEWLNDTATIVVLIVMVCLLFGLAVWLFKFIGGLFARVYR